MMTSINYLCLLAGCWLFTYLIHSTVLSLAVQVLIKLPGLSGNKAKSSLLKLALVGSCLTTTFQLSFGMGFFAQQISQQEEIMVQNHGYSNAIQAGLKANDGSFNRQQIPAKEDAQPFIALRMITIPVNASFYQAVNWFILSYFLISLLIIVRKQIVRRRFFNSLNPLSPIEQQPIQQLLITLCEQSNIKKKITLASSASLTSPLAIGPSKIYIPEIALTEMSEDKQKGMLAHELAHLVRKDPYWLTVIEFIESVFFFQPLNQVLRKRLQEVTEQLCDEWAVNVTGNGRELANCLVQVASWINFSDSSVLLARMAPPESSLHQRVMLLLDNKRREEYKRKSIPLCALFIGFMFTTCLLVPGIKPVYAQQNQNKPEQASSNQVTKKRKPVISINESSIIVKIDTIRIDSIQFIPSIDPPTPQPKPVISPNYKTKLW